MQILRIVMNGEEYPTYTITKAFENAFEKVDTVWWEQHPINLSLNVHIQQLVTSNKYDAVFMQLQSDGVIMKNTAQILSQNSKVYNWTGDVRTNIDWYVRMGQFCTTLFTNETDVHKISRHGLDAHYLQVGYDTAYYFNKRLERSKYIVFVGNYYPHTDFPLSNYRLEMVRRLKYEFGDNFKLYGGNWDKAGIRAEKTFVNNSEEAEIYNTCGLAISCSHFNYGRYFSDRLLREMACGATVLSHDYSNYHIDFVDGEHAIFWKDFDHLVELCKYYLENEHICKKIGENASSYVLENFTWDSFCQNFIKIINPHK